MSTPHIAPGLAKSLSFACLFALVAAAPATRPTTAPASKPASIFHTTPDGLAAGGYDVLSYFDGSPVLGSADHASDYLGATFRFASADHKAKFDADPAKYAPQFGGYCAFGMSKGYRAKTDPTAWTVHNGKLYLNYNAGVTTSWRKNVDALIAKADENWKKLNP